MTYAQELRTAAKALRATANADRIAVPLAELLEFEAPYCERLARDPYPGTHQGHALAVARVINQEARRG